MGIPVSRLPRRKMVLALSLLLPALPAYSQSSSDKATKLEEVTVTATATTLDIRDAPASVSIVTAEDIKKIATNDLNEVLRRLPGVSQGTTPDGGTSIQIRGLPQRYTLVLIDGQRTGSSSDTYDRYSRNELNWVPVESIERIEVVRGPMSSLYGSDAMGGVINIITKKTAERWGGSVSAGAILNQNPIRGDDYNGGFSVGGSLARGLKLRLNGQQTYHQSDSRLPQSAGGAFRWGGGREGLRRHSFGGRLDWDISAKHRLSLDYQRSEWQTLPAAEGDVSNPAGFSAAAFTRGPAKMQRESLGLNYAGKHGFGTSKFSVNQIEYKNDTTAPLIRDGQLVLKDPPDRRDPYVSHPSTAVAKELIVDGSLSMPLKFGLNQLLTVGGQYIRSSLDNPNSVGALPNADGVVGLSYKKVNSEALYAEDQLFLRDNLSLTLGTRVDHHDDYGSHVSPRAYLVYHPASEWTIRGGYSEGFRAPTLRESNPNYVSESLGAGCAGGYLGGGCYTRGNAGLKPETTRNWELGSSWDHNSWQAGLTVFNTNFKDKIYERGLGYLGGSRYWQQYVNIAKALTRGVEASFVLPLVTASSISGIHSLIWRSNVTRMLKAENRVTGEPLSAVPKWAANSSIDWQVTHALGATLQAEFVGRQVNLEWREANNSNRFGDQRIQHGYMIYDLGVNYQINKQLRLNAGVRNLFDRNANGDIDKGNNYYTPGRRYFTTLTASF